MTCMIGRLTQPPAFRYLSLAWRLAERREVVVPKQEGWTIPPPAEERGGIRL